MDLSNTFEMYIYPMMLGSKRRLIAFSWADMIEHRIDKTTARQADDHGRSHQERPENQGGCIIL